MLKFYCMCSRKFYCLCIDVDEHRNFLNVGNLIEFFENFKNLFSLIIVFSRNVPFPVPFPSLSVPFLPKCFSESFEGGVMCEWWCKPNSVKRFGTTLQIWTCVLCERKAFQKGFHYICKLQTYNY